MARDQERSTRFSESHGSHKRGAVGLRHSLHSEVAEPGPRSTVLGVLGKSHSSDASAGSLCQDPSPQDHPDPESGHVCESEPGSSISNIVVLDPQILTDSIELGKVQLATGLERSSPKCASDGIRVDLRRQDPSDVAER